MNMKPHITVDDINEIQSLEERIVKSKKKIEEWYQRALEIEDGNINRATTRLVTGIAAGTLQIALDFAVQEQAKTGHGVSPAEMAGRICVSPCFMAVIAWVIGEKILTDDVEVVVEEGEDECSDSSQQLL
jgi:hypothetical protein